MRCPTQAKVSPLTGLSGQVRVLLCNEDTNTVYVGGDFKGLNSSNAIAWVGTADGPNCLQPGSTACQTTKAKVKEEDCGLFCSLRKQCSPESGPLMAAIELRLRGQDTNAKRWVPAPSTSTATPIMPKNMKKLKFLDIDATELARQLSLDSMARSNLLPWLL